MLWRLSKRTRWPLVSAHVQHHLRGQESLRDQRFVEQASRKLGIICRVSSIKLRRKAGLEERARLLRYQALAKIARQSKSNVIFTGHTASDQTETFFLNLLRGAGADGLCGMRAVRKLSDITGLAEDADLLVVRPLLLFTREEILGYLRAQKLSFCEDSSNADTQYRRNWVRHELIPLIRKKQPQIEERIAELTAIFQAEQEARFAETAAMRKSVQDSSGRGIDLRVFFRYHISLRTRLLHELLPQCSYREINRILSLMAQMKDAGLVVFSLKKALARSVGRKAKLAPLIFSTGEK